MISIQNTPFQYRLKTIKKRCKRKGYPISDSDSSDEDEVMEVEAEPAKKRRKSSGGKKEEGGVDAKE